MGDLKVPLSKPKPDYEEFLKAVLTDYEPDRPRLVEYLVNPPVMKAIIEMLGREWVEESRDRAAYWDNFIAMWYHLGYDFVRLELSMNFPHPMREGGDHGRLTPKPVPANPILEDFEKYPWPNPAEADFFPYEYVSKHMPDGMGLISCHAAGPLEWLNNLMGYEPLCIALFDQPDLVTAVSQKLGELMSRYAERLLQIDRLIAYFQGDDMGFRTGTLISPDDLRKYTLPWHRKYAAMAHDRGIPYFLHSCGNVEAVMPDLLDDVHIDAKHSVEDAIMPVQEWKKRYGGRIGILGGVDLNKLGSCNPQELRKYVRKIIDDCAPGGRFALGSGNSIPDYIPVENYLTMLDEALC